MHPHLPFRNRLGFRLVLTLAGILQLAALAVGATPPDSSASAGTHPAIEARRNSFSAAVALGDADAVAGHFSANARLIIPGFDAVVGRESILQAWRFALAGGKFTRLVWQPDSVVEVSGALVVETGLLTSFGPGDQEIDRSNYLLVWHHEDGEWKIFRDVVSPGAAPAAGPTVDRVGFPKNYRDDFAMLAPPRLNQQGLVQTAYGNERAAEAEAGAAQRYPNGSVFVMEFAAAVRDEGGQPRLDPAGNPRRGDIHHIDTMRREAGFGEAYGKNRAGEWEFARFKPDGSLGIPPAKSAFCAECHMKAGAARDFVFPLQ